MNKRILCFAVLLCTAGSAAESSAQSGVKYPYATSTGSTSGKTSVIVSRDGNGGVKTSCIHANWKASAMPTHHEQNAANAVSAKFEVASANLSGTKNWSAALSGCASYTQSGTSAGDWRLPTQRELMLIYVMYKQGSMGEFSWASHSYWSSTGYSSNPSNAWYVAFSYGITDNTDKSNLNIYVRCIRDF